jgi:hypothetical protein
VLLQNVAEDAISFPHARHLFVTFFRALLYLLAQDLLQNFFLYFSLPEISSPQYKQ